MRVTAKRQEAARGLARVTSGPRGYDIKVDGKRVGSADWYWAKEFGGERGFYWSVATDEALGLAWANSSAMGLTYASMEEARDACLRHVKEALAARGEAVNPDEMVCPLVWGVLAQDSKTGAWHLRSVHMTEDEATGACDRETLRVVSLELAPPGTRESAFDAWTAAMKRGDDAERETIARVVAALQVRKATDPSNFIGWAEMIDWLRSGAWKEDGDG